MLLDGIFLPLTTPFYPDGRVYLRKLEHNVDRYSRTPAAGLMVLSQAGEADGLTLEEARETLVSASVVAAREKVLVAGISRESVFATLLLAESAASAQYDAIAVRGPVYAGDHALQAETMTYFQTVADRSALPVLLVSDAERTLGLDVMAELATHPNVIGCVEESGSVARVAELRERTLQVSREVTVTTVFAAATARMLQDASASEAGQGNFVSADTLGGGGTALAVASPKAQIKTRQKKVGFQILFGHAERMLEAWGAGAAGAVPRLGAASPQVCCEVWQAFRDGDQRLAEEKQERIRKAARLTEGWKGIAAVKHGCDLNGYFGGRPRLPLLALKETDREELEAAMEHLRN